MAGNKEMVERIVTSLNNNPAAVERALMLLCERQTSDEQVMSSTRHVNGCGFSQAHARTGTWLVHTVMADGMRRGRPAGQLLRGKALEMGRRIALRYARTQLLQMALAKAAGQTVSEDARGESEAMAAAERYEGSERSKMFNSDFDLSPEYDEPEYDGEN